MRRVRLLLGFGSCFLLLTAFRCPGPDPLGGDPARPVGGGGETVAPGGGGLGGGEPVDCDEGDPNFDDDNDGFTEEMGDCNDCDPDISPGAAELITVPGDENCDGHDDEEPECEPVDPSEMISATDAARVLDLCPPSGEIEWGLIEAKFVRADADVTLGDADIEIQAVDAFGTELEPQLGDHMLSVSTGKALPFACQNGASCGDENSAKNPPPGLLIPAEGCAMPQAIFDDVGLRVEIKPPPNAAGFAFSTAYFTHEYTESVCSLFVDQFVALVQPTPPTWPNANAIFDGAGVPPSASFASFPHCDPLMVGEWALYCEGAGCPPPPDMLCPAGPALLNETGFLAAQTPNGVISGASTGWLTTRVPLVDEEKIVVRFLIFDTGYYDHDSTAVLDAFVWLGPDDVAELPETDL